MEEEIYKENEEITVFILDTADHKPQATSHITFHLSSLPPRRVIMPRPVRLPTQVGYSIIGIGFGMLAACQLFKLHDIQVEESSLFGYGCHEEESKPIMRGVLHTVACVVCLASMTFQYVAKGSSRHPSDFVMAYFLAQYFASATYHRARYS